jgi:hypothetical protein
MTPATQAYFFEAYTKNPQTMEEGWDIQVGFVTEATSRDDAVAQVQRTFGRIFDEIIQCYPAIVSPIRGCPSTTIAPGGSTRNAG